VIGACVIAEPPADLPAVPTGRPNILSSNVTPPNTGVLTRWPSTFFVPVELTDARQTFYLAAYVDYNPITGEGLQAVPFDSPVAPGHSGRQQRTVAVQIPAPIAEGCHTVEMIVAFSLQDVTGGLNDRRASHTAARLDDGDSITWYYSTNGDPSGCALIDAGLLPDAAALEAGAGSVP
jgi:hypothetical protein